MSEEDLKRLLALGTIERVGPDRETARRELTAARKHINAAEKIMEDDPTLAFTGFYDAMRKTITAHMRWHGYRVSKGPGGHAKTVAYANAALDHLDIQETLNEFDALRLLRNQSEYDALFINPKETAEASKHARLLLEAVERDLGLR